MIWCNYWTECLFSFVHIIVISYFYGNLGYYFTWDLLSFYRSCGLLLLLLLLLLLCLFFSELFSNGIKSLHMHLAFLLFLCLKHLADALPLPPPKKASFFLSPCIVLSSLWYSWKDQWCIYFIPILNLLHGIQSLILLILIWDFNLMLCRKYFMLEIIERYHT